MDKFVIKSQGVVGREGSGERCSAEVTRTARELRERLSIAVRGAQYENGWISQTLRKGEKLEDFEKRFLK